MTSSPSRLEPQKRKRREQRETISKRMTAKTRMTSSPSRLEPQKRKRREQRETTSKRMTAKTRSRKTHKRKPPKLTHSVNAWKHLGVSTCYSEIIKFIQHSVKMIFMNILLSP